MSIYVTDTHSLIYYFSARTKLSRRALLAFETAAQDQALIYVPAPALWEVSILEKSGEIKLGRSYQDWTRELFSRAGFDVVPLDAEIIAEARHYGFNNDIFDAAIVATAKLKDVPLISKDIAITESGLVEIYW